MMNLLLKPITVFIIKNIFFKFLYNKELSKMSGTNWLRGLSLDIKGGGGEEL